MGFQYPSVAKIGIPAALAVIGLLLLISWRRGRSNPYRGGVRAYVEILMPVNMFQ